MSEIIELVIAGIPSCNSAAAVHWRTRHEERKLWKRKVCAAVLETLGRWPDKPLDRAHVTLTRCSSREPDPDNLASSWKFVLDSLQLAGVILNDSSDCITLDVRWEKASPRKSCVRIRVEPRMARQTAQDASGATIDGRVDSDSGVEIGPRMAADDATGGVG